MKKFLLTVAILLITLNIFADAKGEEIARKNFDLKESKDNTLIATMVLINKNGDKRIRKLKMFSKEGKDGRNSFISFLEPADVKGTNFLTIGHKKGDDEQRLYLPALGKVRKISSSKKSGRFMGSDLYYYDMEDHEFADYTYKYIKDDAYKGMDCHVIAMFPTDENAPYSKQIAWINKENYFMYKAECYDKKGAKSLIKTIVFLDVKDFNGVLIATKIVVDNHKGIHKTLLQMDDVKINVGLKDSVFTVQNLQR